MHDYYIDHASVRNAITAYSRHVRERVISHSVSLHSGVTLQKVPIKYLGELLGIEDLGKGINFLRRDSNTVTPTAPPDEDAQARTLSLCQALFDGLSDLVLNGRPYPFGLSMPHHLSYPNDTMWIFPSNVWCMQASKLESSHAGYRRGGFDYRDGRLITKDEILESERSDRQKRANGVIQLAKKVLDGANDDLRHRHRRFMGMIALNAFIHLFLARTGMNWAQIVELKWVGDRKSTSSIRQKFRCIKVRARGKEVNFQLPLRFMPSFKRFLELRHYLLQGHADFDSLFFNLGINAVGVPSPIKSAMPAISTMLRRIDPSLVQIRSRAWRAAKSDWLITRTDVSTAAQLLQNTELTVLKSYSAGSIETHTEQMSDFLDRIATSKRDASKIEEVTAVGACVAHGSPAQIAGVTPTIIPNCEAPEAGCLFCDKFKIHADETDVRKLLSCRYTLARTTHLAGFHETSGAIIDRIDAIMNQVRRRDDALVQQIAEEVDEGELDPYWASKFDLLLKLRLVNDVN